MHITEAAGFVLLGALPFIVYLLATKSPPRAGHDALPGAFDEPAAKKAKKKKGKAAENEGDAQRVAPPARLDDAHAATGAKPAADAPRAAPAPQPAGQSAAPPARAAPPDPEPSRAPEPPPAGKKAKKGKKAPGDAEAPPAASYASIASGDAKPPAEARRTVLVEPAPDAGAKWLETDEAEEFVEHRVMRIVEPKAEEKPRLPEADGWTTVKGKGAPAPKPAASKPAPPPPQSVPGQPTEELTKTQRKNRAKAEKLKAAKAALAEEQDARLKQHKAEQRAAGIGMRYVPPPGAAVQRKPKPPADDFGDVWD
ncbi:hypothetical protein DFJ74DRAFT_708854 [Hyaloraphidium curvatum]|nr:hypothetical protein DFJ74DRAFT_708854 [Hyaloraphidium curvatum]